MKRELKLPSRTVPNHLYRNVYDAIETASMIDPRDRKNFFFSSRNLGIYYESRHQQNRLLMAELIPSDTDQYPDS